MYHKIIIAGNLGKAPEMKYTPSGQPVTNLNVATNEQWTDKQGQVQKRTTWWRVTVWGKQAENCNQYLVRGSKVLIEGAINVDAQTGSLRTFTRQDGSVGASLEVTANTVRFLDNRNEENSQYGSDQGYNSNQNNPTGNRPPANNQPENDDDIPF